MPITVPVTKVLVGPAYWVLYTRRQLHSTISQRDIVTYLMNEAGLTGIDDAKEKRKTPIK